MSNRDVNQNYTALIARRAMEEGVIDEEFFTRITDGTVSNLDLKVADQIMEFLDEAQAYYYSNNELDHHHQLGTSYLSTEDYQRLGTDLKRKATVAHALREAIADQRHAQGDFVSFLEGLKDRAGMGNFNFQITMPVDEYVGMLALQS